MPNSGGFDGVRGMSEAINQGINETVVHPIAKHLTAPPVEKNRKRAIWGTRLVVACLCIAYFQWTETRYGLFDLVRFYIRELQAPYDESFPFYVWGLAVLFGLLWLRVGLKGSRAPRDTMRAFWALLRVAAFGAVLWQGIPAIAPKNDQFVQGILFIFLASSLMSLYLAMRGTGSGAVQLVQQQIERQSRIFRIGRWRSF